MTEEYLHFIWHVKRFMSPDFTLTNGTQITIRRFGTHNVLLSGPDFSHGVVRTDDGIEWHGPIEMHVKSSDWMRHGHQNDRAYDNVILHVVFDHDADVIQNGRLLPTLELRDLIDWKHFETFRQFSLSRNDIICARQLQDADPVFLENMMEKSLFLKWSEKVKAMDAFLSGPQPAMYYFLGAAFGGNHNKEAFLQTIDSVSVKELRQLAPDQRYNVLLSQSGLVSNETIARTKWNFRGLRPGNFPTKRLYQMAHYLCDDQLELLVELSSTKEILTAFREIIAAQTSEVRLSKAFQDNLLINAVVPYLFYTGQIRGNEMYQERALELLRQLPAEDNRITRKWKEVGVSLSSAMESQGLLALYRYYCAEKRCLQCEVGAAILSTDTMQPTKEIESE